MSVLDMFPHTDSAKRAFDVFPTTDNVKDINPPGVSAPDKCPGVAQVA